MLAQKIEVSGLRVAGFFLLVTGWGIALSAMLLLAAPLSQFAFVAVGIAIQILGFVFIAADASCEPGRSA